LNGHVAKEGAIWSGISRINGVADQDAHDVTKMANGTTRPVFPDTIEECRAGCSDIGLNTIGYIRPPAKEGLL
jgi:hypothetical protein